LFSVSLSRLTEDPNDPLVRERQRRAQGGRGSRTRAAGEISRPRRTQAVTAPAQGRGGPPPALTTPNVDGHSQARGRADVGRQPVQFYFLSADGRTVYFRSSDDQGPALFSVSIEGRDRQRLVAGRVSGHASRRSIGAAPSSPRVANCGRSNSRDSAAARACRSL
jgi:hypothetical protein